MYLNKALIIGNLTRDPEMKALPSGMQVTSFSVATNRVWKDKAGAKQESVDYHNIVVFGKQAETSAQYLKKGQSVLIEGRIQTRSWDGTDGKKQYRTEIVADRVQFGQKTGGATGAPKKEKSPEEAEADRQFDSYGEEGAQPGKSTGDSDEINVEDIPF